MLVNLKFYFQGSNLPAEILIFAVNHAVEKVGWHVRTRAQLKYLCENKMHFVRHHKRTLRSINIQKRLPTETEGLEMTKIDFNTSTEFLSSSTRFGQQTTSNHNLIGSDK